MVFLFQASIATKLIPHNPIDTRTDLEEGKGHKGLEVTSKVLWFE